MQISEFRLARRWAGVGLGASFILLAALHGACAESPATLRVSTIPTLDGAAFEIAVVKGMFEAEGLKIDTTPTAGGAVGFPAVVSGQLQVAASNIVTILLAASQGLQPVIIAGGDTTGDTPPDLAGLVGKKGTTYKTGKDLEGKTIAVNARNNIIWLYAREWIAKTGGDPNKVTFIEVPFPQMVDAVRGGRVDTAMLVEPFLSAALKASTIDVIGWPYSDVQKRIPVAQFVMTKSYADAHPDIVARFTRAYNRGVDWATANIGGEEFAQIVTGYTKVPADRLKDAAKPIFVKKVDASAVETVAALMKKHGLLKTDVDVKAIIHPSVMQ
ncbi:MAG TPA: ABC transporter substrate-binding protein [Alphaproteobacteria bacterium]|jgi:NitT/TauT family transport system substrate-binding protein|nr:ABC transporter substrate-binding protein [Alphaproteobacteria bacterium]